MVELANRAGANTKRHELAAALVSAAVVDGDQLLELIIGWRRRRVRDVVLDIPTAADVVEMPRHPPGRRRRA